MSTSRKGLILLFSWIILVSAFGAALADDTYGAIAYSKSTGTYGYSYDYASRSEAEQAALSHCKRDDCEIKSWFKNSCGALAKAGNGALGYSWAAANRQEAESIALEQCRKRGSNCRILCWACTSR